MCLYDQFKGGVDLKKAVVKISIALLLAALCVFVFTGSTCTCLSDPESPHYERREVGDFIVRFYDDYCEIEGTTEQGNSQRFLVIPEYIEGVKVRSFGFASLFSNYTYARINSDALEKVYCEAAIGVYGAPFIPCPNMKKLIYPVLNDYAYWNLGGNGVDVYYPRSEYEKGIYNGIGVNCANVSYYYNYENGDEYYWIDDCDYGSIIEFIPPAPEREGYIFGGWYKEPECINEWDFETDTLPEEKIEINENGEEEVVYQETILYAKWIED